MAIILDTIHAVVLYVVYVFEIYLIFDIFFPLKCKSVWALQCPC
jgi:hypothetical protein